MVRKGDTISTSWARGRRAAVGCAIAAGLFAPARGIAQAVDVGGQLGFYSPIGALVQRGSKTMPISYFQKRLQGTLLAGANVVVWTSSRLGIAGSIGLVPSSVATTDTTGTHDFASTLVLVSARVIYAFTPLRFTPLPGHRELPWSFYVGAGVGVSSRSGAVWSGSYSSGLTSPALVANVGVRTPLGPRMLLRLDVEDYFSQAQFDKGLPTETAARTHNDLVVSVSFAYRVVR
jgi:hypothetical protein